MKVKQLIVAETNRLGISDGVSEKLLELLDFPNAMNEPEDFGLYFFKEERCIELCKGLPEDTRSEAVVILWSVSQKIREGFKGSFTVSYRALCVHKDGACASLSRSSENSQSSSVRGLPRFGGNLVRNIAPGAVSKLQMALSKKRKVFTKIRSEALTAGKKVPVQLRELEIKAKITACCVAILTQLGMVSGRYTMLYGDGSRNPSEKEKEFACKLFFQSNGRSVKVQTVGGYCKEFGKFLEWLKSIGVPLVTITAFHVGTWLSDMAGRGASVPSRCLAALVWAAGVFEVLLYVEDCGVRLEGKGPTERPPPKPARCPSIALVTKIERMVLDKALGDVIRIIAGLCCVLTHGALRWRDFQSSRTFEEAPDALLGSSIMKRQGVRSWVALKGGFSGLNWGTPFFELLKKYDMPTSEAILKCPTPDLKGFRDRGASFSDALHAMRMLFVTHLSMTAEEACSYTLHGWRHVVITAGRQLPIPLSRDQQNEVGHWVANSNMPNTYDAVASSVEMNAKKRVIEFFQDGKELVAPGEFRREIMDENSPFGEDVVEPPVKASRVEAQEHKENKASEGCCKRRSIRGKSNEEFPVLSPVQVEHALYGRLHLYNSEIKCRKGEIISVRTVCGKWKCGCPEAPTKYANFYESFDTIPLEPERFAVLEFEACGDCFHERLLGEHNWRAFIPTKDELMLDALTDISEESSCSSDGSS